MRPLPLVIPIALLALVTACSTSSTPIDETTAPATTEETTQAQPPAGVASGATTEAAPTTTAGGAPAGGASGTTLTGALGANDAFIITLVDDKGAAVTTLKAGSYQVKVKDTSKIHNFHLNGPGVEQTTSVPELKDTTWSVTFKAGTYTYQCDPHPNMKKTFTVT